jgi:hypothetical protein
LVAGQQYFSSSQFPDETEQQQASTATCSLKLLTQFFDEIDFLSIFLSCSAQLMGKLLELNELSAGKTSFVSQYDSIICVFWGLDRDWHPK